MLITIPKILREKLGEEAAEGLVELLNNFSEHTHNSVISLAVEKFERRLAEELGKLRAELQEQHAEFREQHASLRAELTEHNEQLRSELVGQNANLRSEFTEQTEKLRSELFEKIERNQASTIRWMFLFWVGQIGTLLGILFAFFR